MDYQFNIQLSYEQLLNLALQLPIVEQQKLIHTIKEKVENQVLNPLLATPKITNWSINFKPKTIKEILAPNYVYKPVNKNLLVGCWEGTESVEMLLALRKK
jgi:hypothetical protein